MSRMRASKQEVNEQGGERKDTKHLRAKCNRDAARVRRHAPVMTYVCPIDIAFSGTVIVPSY